METETLADRIVRASRIAGVRVTKEQAATMAYVIASNDIPVIAEINARWLAEQAVRNKRMEKSRVANR